MSCDRLTDERLAADKMDVLYGEADAEVRARLDEHLAQCENCREELAALGALRKDLSAWREPAQLRASTPRSIVVPRWLAAAAALLIGVGLGVTGSGYLSLRRAVAEQAERAAALEARQRETQRALQAALRAAPRPERSSGLLATVDGRIEEKLRASEARQLRQFEIQLADLQARSEAQRRVDLARVAEGLSYLDGQHGQQLARTNELMSYVLQTGARR